MPGSFCRSNWSVSVRGKQKKLDGKTSENMAHTDLPFFFAHIRVIEILAPDLAPALLVNPQEHPGVWPFISACYSQCEFTKQSCPFKAIKNEIPLQARDDGGKAFE